MKTVKDIAVWFCDACRSWLEGLKLTDNKGSTSAKDDESNICCECFEYIKILTDQVSGLSENYKNMSANFQTMSSEQSKVKSVVDSHSEYIDQMLGLSQQTTPSVSPTDHGPSVSVMNLDEPQIKSVWSAISNSLPSGNPVRECNQVEVSKPNQVSNITSKPNDSNQDWKEVSYGSKRGRGGRARDNNRGNFVTRTQIYRSRPSYVSKVSGPRTNEERVKDDDEGTERFGLTKPSYSSMLKSNSKNKVVYGTKQVSSSETELIKPAKKLFWIFLSGLDPSVEPDAIVTYLKSLKDCDSYSCEKLKTRYDTYSSFKIGVPFELGEYLMHPNLWFEGCIVGKYHAPRNRAVVTSNNENFLGQNRQTSRVT